MKLAAFKVAGYKVRTTNENNQMAQDIGGLWQKVMSGNLLANVPNQTKQEMISLYYEYESDYTKPYSYLLGVPVDNFDALPKGMVAVEIPAQDYEVFAAKGKMPEAIVNTWQEIWQKDKALKRNYRFDFEVHDATSFSEQPLVNIWIGVKS